MLVGNGCGIVEVSSGRLEVALTLVCFAPDNPVGQGDTGDLLEEVTGRRWASLGSGGRVVLWDLV